MTLGNRIKNYRRALGLTQVELGEKSKLSQGYISTLEKGVFEPTASTIVRLAAAFGITTDELLGVNEEKKVS